MAPLVGDFLFSNLLANSAAHTGEVFSSTKDFQGMIGMRYVSKQVSMVSKATSMLLNLALSFLRPMMYTRLRVWGSPYWVETSR